MGRGILLLLLFGGEDDVLGREEVGEGWQATRSRASRMAELNGGTSRRSSIFSSEGIGIVSCFL